MTQSEWIELSIALACALAERFPLALASVDSALVYRGLDIGAIENIHRQILAERDRGVAILLVSLELDEIMNLADTIGVIYNGQLLKTAPANTLTSHDVGRYMMGVTEA